MHFWTILVHSVVHFIIEIVKYMQHYNITMLELEEVKQIKDFVKQKPRTMNEISQLLDVNWRTADRHVGKIAETSGELAVRTFREGTRGALKVVYWKGLGELAFTDLQQDLFERIAAGRKKYDFSPFEIYQHVEKDKKYAFLQETGSKVDFALEQFVANLRKAEERILFFSGNNSWIDLAYENKGMLEIIKEILEKNIQWKALCRVELPLANIERLLALNKAIGKNAIEIRHSPQPLRALIIDDKLVQFKEVKVPADYKKGELEKEVLIFYEIYDKEWIGWVEKVFWKLFQTSMPAEKRIAELGEIRRLA